MTAVCDLIKAVEAGREVTVGMVRPVFPEPAHMDLVFIALRPNDIRAEGAALSLMAAVLPDHAAVIDTGDNSVKMHERIFWDDGQPTDDWEWLFEVSADTPARALLLAILKAMEARK